MDCVGNERRELRLSVELLRIGTIDDRCGYPFGGGVVHREGDDCAIMHVKEAGQMYQGLVCLLNTWAGLGMASMSTIEEAREIVYVTSELIPVLEITERGLRSNQQAGKMTPENITVHHIASRKWN